MLLNKEFEDLLNTLFCSYCTNVIMNGYIDILFEQKDIIGDIFIYYFYSIFGSFSSIFVLLV